MKITVERGWGGELLLYEGKEAPHVFRSTEELFTYLLILIEQRYLDSSGAPGDRYYGKVTIKRQP